MYPTIGRHNSSVSSLILARALHPLLFLLLIAGMTLVASCGTHNAPVPLQTPSPDSTIDWSQEWRNWKATTQVQAPTLSQEEAELLRQEWIVTAMAPYAPADIDHIPAMVHWDDDIDTSFVACVAEAGFDAKAHGIAGDLIVDNIPESQRDLLHSTMFRCRAQYPPPAHQMLPWSDDQYRVEFEYLSDFYFACLQAHGLTYSGPTPPSSAEWVTQRGSIDQWSPTDPEYWRQQDGQALSATQAERLAHTCPAKPPASALYGDAR